MYCKHLSKTITESKCSECYKLGLKEFVEKRKMTIIEHDKCKENNLREA
jgi:hypothetical protein